MTEPVAGLLLAAGGGSRFGRPKALVEFDGEPLVERGLRLLAAGGCDPVVVVLGAAAGQVRATAPLAGATVVVNPDWTAGLGSSLRAGLATLAGLDPAPAAVVVALVDQPLVTPAAVRRLATAYGSAPGPAAVVASYGGRPRNPVLLARSCWDEVAAAAVGDVGARGYLSAHPDRVIEVPCDDVARPDDVDTPFDLRLLVRKDAGVQLERSFVLPVPPADSWRVLLDADRVWPCVPGSAAPGTMKVKIGPVSITYRVEAEVTEQDRRRRRLVTVARAREVRGGAQVGAVVAAALHPDTAGTRVDLVADLEVDGRAAQFGPAQLGEVGARLVDRFAARLRAQLTGAEVAPEPMTGEMPVVVAPAAPAEPAAVAEQVPADVAERVPADVAERVPAAVPEQAERRAAPVDAPRPVPSGAPSLSAVPESWSAPRTRPLPAAPRVPTPQQPVPFTPPARSPMPAAGPDGRTRVIAVVAALVAMVVLLRRRRG